MEDSSNSVGGLAASFSLAASLAITGFMTSLGLLVLVLGTGQSTEWLLFLVAFAVIAPAAAFAAPMMTGRLSGGHGPDGAVAVASAALAVAAGAVILSRLVASAFDVRPALSSLLAGALGLVVVTLLIRSGPWIASHPRARFLWLVALSAIALAPLVFVPSGSVDGAPLIVCAVVAAIGFVVARRGAVPELSRRAGLLVDLAIVVLVLLTVPDLTLYVGGTGQIAGSEASTIAIHMNFFLGPVNDVLAGRTVLVESSSQYGVAPIYVLAALFEIVPIGYGTLGLLSGIAAALALLCTYAVLRIAGSGRIVAAGTVALAIAVTIFNVRIPVAGFAQLSPLRFGLPLLIVLAATVAARWPRRRSLWIATTAIVGIASVWSLETLIYSVTAFGAVLLYKASIATDRRSALRGLFVGSAQALGACMLAHLLLALFTLALAGQLPEWGTYLTYFQTYATGSLAELSGFDFAPFSLGFVAGGILLASVLALIVLIRRRDPMLTASPVALIAITAATGYGVGEFTYFVGRSPSFVLPYVSLPTILVAGLWVGLLLERGGWIAPARRVTIALAAWVAALLLAGSWSKLSYGADRSPLGYLVNSDISPRDAVARLWGSPVLDIRAPEGERLLAEAIPDSEEALVLTQPDLGTEILLRSGRVNLLQLGHARQDDLIRDELAPGLRDEIDSLADGTRMLTQQSFLDAPPPADPLSLPIPILNLGTPVPLQQWILEQIKERFRLRPVARGMATAEDLVVVELIGRDQFPSE